MNKYGVPCRINGKHTPEYQRARYHEYKTTSAGYAWYRVNSWKQRDISIDSYGQFLTLLAMSQYKCEICRKQLTEKTAHLDHDHDTGRVMGILCRNCNVAIGYIKRPVHLLNAGLYLHNNKEFTRCQGSTTTGS